MIHARNGVTDAITNNTPATSTAPNASAENNQALHKQRIL